MSVFHGIDLFGRGFEREGFFVVRAGEIDLGFDVRDLHLPSGKFNGIIAGTPCQDFSLGNRTGRTFTGYGAEMLKEFERLVLEAQPDWFLLENVPTVPDIEIENYKIQRFDLNAKECGLKQNRLRHFQFGSLTGNILVIDRQPSQTEIEPCCMATEGTKKNRRPWDKFCELQGLPRNFDLPLFKQSQKYKVVGNGVPVEMARIIARSIRESTWRKQAGRITVCNCLCGRPIKGRQIYATAACRKRAQIKRDRASKF
ncbi:MAG TPA: DNA cytosine methyltransferase [Pyrinomonadaceae bacterium]